MYAHVPRRSHQRTLDDLREAARRRVEDGGRGCAARARRRAPDDRGIEAIVAAKHASRPPRRALDVLAPTKFAQRRDIAAVVHEPARPARAGCAPGARPAIYRARERTSASTSFP